jgi:diacylglycerol kinase (ATP)
VLVIANPVSGAGRAPGLANELVAELQAAGCKAEVHFTEDAADATRRARAAGSETWQAIVAAGGDGTVADVINGLTDFSRPLGVLPIGTANVLAVEYRLPRKPRQVARLLLEGHTRPHGVGIANGRRFLLFCGVGVDAAIVERLEQAPPRSTGKRKWLQPILHVIRRWPRFDLAVRLPDGRRITDLRSVLVTRVRNYGGVARLVPGIDPADGKLHAMCFSGRSRSWWLLQGLRASLGLMRENARLRVIQTDAIRIEGSAPCQLDGDFAGSGKPVEIAMHPNPLHLFAPR